MKKNNYHTHTFRCKHATGDVVDYAREAFNGGATILGISDHVPWPDHRWDEVRMDISQLDEYEQAIDYARKTYPKLKILKGMECEYNKEFHSYLEDELLEWMKCHSPFFCSIFFHWLCVIALFSCNIF